MKTIRCNVFETNSSSEHVVTLLNEEEYKKFENGECYYSVSNGNFVNLEDWKEFLKYLQKDETIKQDKEYAERWPNEYGEYANDGERFKAMTEEEVEKVYNFYISQTTDDGLLAEYDVDDADFEELSETENRFIYRIMRYQDKNWDVNSWGRGYENSEIGSITTPKGDVVYALSYSGYAD